MAITYICPICGHRMFDEPKPGGTKLRCYRHPDEIPVQNEPFFEGVGSLDPNSENYRIGDPRWREPLGVTAAGTVLERPLEKVENDPTIAERMKLRGEYENLRRQLDPDDPSPFPDRRWGVDKLKSNVQYLREQLAAGETNDS